MNRGASRSSVVTNVACNFGSNATRQKLVPDGASRIFVRAPDPGSNDQRLSFVVQKILPSSEHVIPRSQSLDANCVNAMSRIVLPPSSISLTAGRVSISPNAYIRLPSLEKAASPATQCVTTQ